MKVFKFGGASLESAERLASTAEIIRGSAGEKLLIVISALGKTTNKLEQVAGHFYMRRRDTAASLLHLVKQKHAGIAGGLLGDSAENWLEEIKKYARPVEWLMGEKPHKPYDYYYDQIVSLGELMSSLLVNAYLNHLGISASWLDIRKIILTDDNYREAGIRWEASRLMVENQVLPHFDLGNILVTQGFIGGSPDQQTTTLGREGSDYSAAVLANLGNAQSLTIWKDVEGLKNADPKLFPGTVPIGSISYSEVIEMAYYGAQVIHPKTIKPLQNKNIPLYVKSFLNRDHPGTLVNGSPDTSRLPPLIILKSNQVLLTITARDFSFITGDKISGLYDIFHTLRIQINLMQNAAISFSACIDHDAGKMEELIRVLHRDFTVTSLTGLELLTIRHYRPELIDQLSGGRMVYLEQRSPLTVQLLMTQA